MGARIVWRTVEPAALVFGFLSSAGVQVSGSEQACPDGSVAGLSACLRKQIQVLQNRLAGVFQRRLSALHDDERDRFAAAEASWDTAVGPHWLVAADQMGLQPHWTSIAALECRLDQINRRILLLSK